MQEKVILGEKEVAIIWENFMVLVVMDLVTKVLAGIYYD